MDDRQNSFIFRRVVVHLPHHRPGGTMTAARNRLFSRSANGRTTQFISDGTQAQISRRYRWQRGKYAGGGLRRAACGAHRRHHDDARANDQLELAATRARELVDVEAERVVRFGLKLEQILGLIEEDPDISLLVLAASSGPEGPGPLVTLMAGKAAGTFPIPVVIVPGALTDEDIEALA